MSAKVHVIAGPARSGKTTALVARYRQVLGEAGIGRALWLAPTGRAAEQIRSALLDENFRGCLGPGIYTFKQFAELVLAQSDEPIRPIGRLLKRRLIERILAEFRESGRLQHFAPIAETAGLVDLLAALISDLKRQEIWPDQFAAKIESADPTPKDRELAALYAEYQRLLTEHHLYDAEGRFWSARELLESGHWGPFANIQFVAIDGFTDFTHTQHEILQLLAGRGAELSITLPLEQEAGRDDLFRKPRQTLDELRRRHPGLAVEWTARVSPAAWPALQHLEGHLFRSPRELQPAADAARVEIVAASGQLPEIEAVARRIKELLISGDPETGQPARPGEIAVVFHAVDGVAPLVQEVFDEYGIPVAIDSVPRLNRAPALAALAGMLRLQVENWPFRQLLAVLANNYFRPSWPEWNGGASAAPTEWAIRELQIPRDRRELLKAVEFGAQTDRPAAATTFDGQPGDDLDAARQRERREKYRVASAVLTRLAKALSALDRPRTLHEWVAALADLVDELGVLDAEDDAGPAWSRYDREAWETLRTVLKAEEKLEAQLDGKANKISLEQFARRVSDILSVEPLPIDHDETGRVRVLSAQSVRALEAPFLFVAGLAEKAFPPPAREDRIYGEAERRRLNQAGLRFVDERERGCEEMLLFYEVVTRATRRLVLSYPALDEKAQPLLPSPYLIELERCLGLKPKIEISLSPVPERQRVYSPTEQRVKAVAELPTSPQRLAALIGGANDNGADAGTIVAGLRSIISRATRGAFGEYEGIVSGEAAQRRLTELYGPQHCWSVSRLEEYAYCPYRFFAGNVLGIEELPDLALEVDYRRRGLLAHQALAALHRRLNEAGKPRSPRDVGASDFAKFKDDTIAVLLESWRAGSELDQALREVDIRQIARWMRDYFEQHEKYESQAGKDVRLRPAHFEVSFGLKAAGAGDPLSTEKPLELRCGDEVIRMSGRIDRIDVGIVDEQVVFNVIDYKTGSKIKLDEEDVKAGRGLQLPLYALAVQELQIVDRRAMPWRVGYWYLRERGFESHCLPQLFQQTDAGLGETDAWRELRGTLLARVASLVRGVRSGAFPVYSLDDKCTTWCPYNTVCRIGQIRSMDKTWTL